MLYSSTRFVEYFLVWILLWVRYPFCLVRNFRVFTISLFLIEFYYILLIPWSLTACPSTFSLPTGHFLQLVSKFKFPPNYKAKHFTTTPPQSLPISLLPHTPYNLCKGCFSSDSVSSSSTPSLFCIPILLSYQHYSTLPMLSKAGVLDLRSTDLRNPWK